MTNNVQWLVLPTKANKDMEQAGADAAREYMERTGGNNLYAIYEAMVLAAPQPPRIADVVSSEMPEPVDDSELPVVGDDIYNAWDMAQQYNGCLQECLVVVKRLEVERKLHLQELQILREGVDAYESIIADLTAARDARPAGSHNAVAWIVGTAIWWSQAEAERDAELTGQAVVPLVPCSAPA
ncbi:hypothetical protein [Pseudomonas sp. Irchel 3E13]|uniref:hypothetical protein n=1 Tax=Pseudomonas sp. Irchel 3E13 TaxID=2008975 RepID=UPI000BA2D58A|nr:hypothetical protein [Pseudomonas sp. Irchel 3E13]